MNQRNFGFVSSALEYTQRFFGPALKMEERGITAYWICHRQSEFDWLAKQGVPESRRLLTGNYLDEKLAESEIKEQLAKLDSYGPPYVNDIILMDRFLTGKPTEMAYRYLAHLDRVLTAFITENRLSFITGGHDTALQILCLLVARKLNVTWAMATGTRLPKERYGFITDSVHSSFIPLRKVDEESRAFAAQFVSKYREKRLKPDYVHFQDSLFEILKGAPKYLKIFIQNLYYSTQDKDDFVPWYSNWKLVKMYFSRRWNMLRLRLRNPFQELGDSPYILYALQVQPESSIDVICSYYSDQLTLIKQIRKVTPVTHELYVKAHPGDIGAKGPLFFKQIRSIPGVRLINPHLDSTGLILGSSLVLSPSGTICYEAALWDIPSIVFTPIFFSRHPLVNYCKGPTHLLSLIQNALQEKPKAPQDQAQEFLAKLHAASVEGQFDAYFRPFSSSEIEGLCSAYEGVFRFCEQPKALTQ